MSQLLNKESFSKRFTVAALRVIASSVGPLREKVSRNLILSLPRVKTVVNDEKDPSKRLLLLSEAVKDVDSLPVEARALVEEYQAEVIPYTITLGFEHYTTQEVLEKVLPEGIDVPSSFETVGHVAHVNLRDEHEPFKSLIGHVILEKNVHIRTVVNKVGSIDNTFRFFNMEVIAGENLTKVKVYEEGCQFEFDYAKVYWNSRLQFEHRRLVQLMNPGSYICDMFCGVGPFALPAAKKGCIVYANDLNPESIMWLKHNVGINKLDNNVKVFNLDARVFVAQAIKDLLALNHGHFTHFIMNLPASAHEFLDIFPQLANEGVLDEQTISNATIHCYIFCKSEEDPIEKIESGLGLSISKDDNSIKVRRVRDVAPNKEMFCVSFKLSKSTIESRKPKRICT